MTEPDDDRGGRTGREWPVMIFLSIATVAICATVVACGWLALVH